MCAVCAGCAAPAQPAQPAPVQTVTAPARTATSAPTLTPFVAPSATPAPLFDGARAYAWVTRQVAHGPRITGTAGNRALGDEILAELAAQGWRAQAQDFSYKNTPARNLIATKTNPRSKEWVALGAHYDTRKRADQDPAHPDQPVPGANDAASGAAVLLELARVLDVNAAGKNIALVFFDAEDNGDLDGWDWIIGSEYFAAHLSQTLPVTPSAVVVLDMIGDKDLNIFYEKNSDPALSAEIWGVAQRLGFAGQFIPSAKWSMEDDHTPFLRRGIRAVDVIDFDYPDWHRVSDTPDKVSADSLFRVGRTMQAWLELK